MVVSRNNTMDMQLILVLLVAAWFLFRAIETGKNRWIFLCAVMIGLGFNIKMLQACMILPAVILVYLLCGKGKLWKRFVSCAVCAAILVGVSLSWTTIVDLTPVSQRQRERHSRWQYGGGQDDSLGIISYVESNASKVDTSEYGGKNGEVSAALYCFNSSTSTSSSSSSK